MHKIKFKNPVTVEIVRSGEVIDSFQVFNDITDEGKNHLLNVVFDAGTQEANWYIGLIDGAGFTTLAAGDTMASHTGWTELTSYDEATRPEWDPTVTGATANNAAVREFTINATVSVQGIFVPADNVKSGTTGVLWATAEFNSPYALIDDDVLRLIYTVQVN